MSKFDEYFSEPSTFSDGTWVVSGKVSREEAADLITDAMIEEGDIDYPIRPEELKSDLVRFGFAPCSVLDLEGQACWYTGASGKGSMPVWCY